MAEVFDVVVAERHFRRNHGVATSAELLGLGLTRRSIRTWVANGHLHREHRGVYRWGPLPLPEPGRFLAAALAAGDAAVVSHRAAAHLLGFLPHANGPVDITTPRARRRRRGITLHCRLLPGEETTVHLGIPTTTAERTLYDLASTLEPKQLRRALHESEVQRRTTHAAMQRFMETHRGAPALRKLLDLGPSPTRSELEDRLLELVHTDPKLPRPRTNTHVDGHEVDLLFTEHDLIVEADGSRFHDTPTARRADAERQARLEAAGYRVIRVRWDDLDRPARTLARIRSAL